MWLGREITKTTWKPTHAVLELFTREYQKQIKEFGEDIISIGHGRVTHTRNIFLATMVRIHIQEYLILKGYIYIYIYAIGSKMDRSRM